MTPTLWGAVLGATAGLGLVVVLARVAAIRRPQLSVRVLPYLRDLRPVADASYLGGPTSSSAAVGVFGPVLGGLAAGLERVVGGSASVRRRLERAGLDRSVHDFRVEQVVWGLVGFGVVAGRGLLV